MDRKEAIAEWSRLYGQPISEEEYDEICRNLSGFFKILMEWDRKEKEGRGLSSPPR